jgi:hypothetical protein
VEGPAHPADTLNTAAKSETLAPSAKNHDRLVTPRTATRCTPRAAHGKGFDGFTASNARQEAAAHTGCARS